MTGTNDIVERAAQQAQEPVMELTIRWFPSKGGFQIIWPQTDDVIRFGMLEFAKSTLIEMRVKAGLAPQPGSGLVIPAGRIPS